MLKVTDPNAYRFIMDEEVYLLPQDKVTKPLPTAAPSAPVPVSEVKTPYIEFNYMGKNNKKFLVVVNYANEEFIAAAHLTALENILKRKDLDLDDVAIFNTHQYAPVTLEQLNSYFKPQKLLVLGQNAMPEGLGAVTLNKPVQGSYCAVLYSFSFDEMMSSNAHKKAFWEQMKQL